MAVGTESLDFGEKEGAEDTLEDQEEEGEQQDVNIDIDDPSRWQEDHEEKFMALADWLRGQAASLA